VTKFAGFIGIVLGMLIIGLAVADMLIDPILAAWLLGLPVIGTWILDLIQQLIAIPYAPYFFLLFGVFLVAWGVDMFRA
jgi:hypothetical protein